MPRPLGTVEPHARVQGKVLRQTRDHTACCKCNSILKYYVIVFTYCAILTVWNAHESSLFNMIPQKPVIFQWPFATVPICTEFYFGSAILQQYLNVLYCTA